MKPCSECGRVNPPEASYCMTCATKLDNTQSRTESTAGESSARQDWSQEPPRAEPTNNADPTEQDKRFEKIAPLVEDFVFDVVRAGVRLYFGAKDPDLGTRAHGYRRQDAGIGERFERFKDVVAEARVQSRRRGQPRDDDRSRW